MKKNLFPSSPRSRFAAVAIYINTSYMKQKVIKSGNSLAITIPSHFVNTVGVKLGAEVEVTTSPEEGKITIHFSGVKQLSLA